MTLLETNEAQKSKEEKLLYTFIYFNILLIVIDMTNKRIWYSVTLTSLTEKIFNIYIEILIYRNIYNIYVSIN